jgi:hypothetical protein
MKSESDLYMYVYFVYVKFGTKLVAKPYYSRMAQMSANGLKYPVWNGKLDLKTPLEHVTIDTTTGTENWVFVIIIIGYVHVYQRWHYFTLKINPTLFVKWGKGVRDASKNTESLTPQSHPLSCNNYLFKTIFNSIVVAFNYFRFYDTENFGIRNRQKLTFKPRDTLYIHWKKSFFLLG